MDQFKLSGFPTPATEGFGTSQASPLLKGPRVFLQRVASSSSATTSSLQPLPDLTKALSTAFASRPPLDLSLESLIASRVQAGRPDDYELPSLEDLGLLLTNLGHRAFLRLPKSDKEQGKDGGKGGAGGSGGHLSLLVRRPVLMLKVNAAGGLAPRQLVVEPEFRAFFRLTKATARYEEVLRALPEVFVGGTDVLRSVLGLVAREIAIVFDELEMPLPPWRRMSALQERFLPSAFTDEYDLRALKTSRLQRASPSPRSSAGVDSVDTPKQLLQDDPRLQSASPNPTAFSLAPLPVHGSSAGQAPRPALPFYYTNKAPASRVRNPPAAQALVVGFGAEARHYVPAANPETERRSNAGVPAPVVPRGPGGVMHRVTTTKYLAADAHTFDNFMGEPMTAPY